MKHAVRAFCLFLLIAFISFIVLEVLLRLCAPLYRPALRAFVKEEAYYNAKSVLRVARGTRIVLEEEEFENGADIVTVGDSMVFGSLSGERDTWPKLITEKTGFSVINLGVGSKGLVTYNAMMKDLLPFISRKPKVIIYSIFANDLEYETAWEVPILKEMFIWGREYRSDGKLQLRRIREWAFQKSILYQLLKRLITARQLICSGERFTPIYFRRGDLEFIFASPDYWSYLDMDKSKTKESVKRLIDLTISGRDIAEGFADRFIVILMPFKEQIYLPVFAEKGFLPRESYDKMYDRPYDLLIDRFKQVKIETIDLRPYFRAEAEKGVKLYFTLDGHLTKKGNDLVATVLSGRLKEIIK